MAKSKKLSQKELIQLGEKLQSFYDSGYVDRKQALWFSFLKGIAAGFGAFLGGTIVIALLIWFLSLFHQFPFVEKINHTLQSSQQSK